MKETGEIADATARAIDIALTGPTGPTYVDYPLDVVFMEGEGEPRRDDGRSRSAAPSGAEEAAAMLGAAPSAR